MSRGNEGTGGPSPSNQENFIVVHYYPGLRYDRSVIPEETTKCCEYQFAVNWQEFKARAISTLEAVIAERGGKDALLTNLLEKFRQIPEDNHRMLALYLKVALTLDESLSDKMCEKMVIAPQGYKFRGSDLLKRFREAQEKFLDELKTSRQPVFTRADNWVGTRYAHDSYAHDVLEPNYSGFAEFYFKQYVLFDEALSGIQKTFKIMPAEIEGIISALKKEFKYDELLAEIRAEVASAVRSYLDMNRFQVITKSDDPKIFMPQENLDFLSRLTKEKVRQILSSKVGKESDSSILTAMARAVEKESVKSAKQAYIASTVKKKLTDGQKKELENRLLEAAKIALLEGSEEITAGGRVTLPGLLFGRGGDYTFYGYQREFSNHFRPVVNRYLDEIGFTNRTEYIEKIVEESYGTVKKTLGNGDTARSLVQEAISAAATEFFKENPDCASIDEKGKIAWKKPSGAKFYEPTYESECLSTMKEAAQKVIHAYYKYGHIEITGVKELVLAQCQAEITRYCTSSAGNVQESTRNLRKPGT